MEKEILRFLKSLDWESILDLKNKQVTEARDYSDQSKVDLILHQKLSEFLPSVYKAAVVSEESEDSVKDPLEYWIIDPLDGTAEFRKGIPDYAVSVGFVKDYEPVLGVIYNPARRESFCSDGTFEVHRNDLKPGQYLLSRSEFEKKLHLEANTLNVEYNIVGSTAYKLGLLAWSKLQVGQVSYQPKSSWDIAGGMGLLKRLYNADLKTLNGEVIRFKTPYVRIPNLVIHPGGR